MVETKVMPNKSGAMTSRRLQRSAVVSKSPKVTIRGTAEARISTFHSAIGGGDR